MKQSVQLLLTWVVALVSYAASSGDLLAGPLDTLPPGNWYEVPNSKIRSVLPSPIPPGNPANIILGWSGGAYDTTRDRFLVWGGGHGDYGGNELYAFDIQTLQWSRVWGPSQNIPQIPTPSGQPDQDNITYSDGNPRSRHTYDCLEYLPTQDAFFFMGGSIWWGGGAGRDTWILNFSGSNVGKWTRKLDVSHPSYAELQAISDYDPVTKHVFLNSQTWELMEFAPENNTWTIRGNNLFHTGGMSAAIDPIRRKYVAIGRGKSYLYSIPTSGTATLQVMSTTGDSGIQNEESPGFVYDSNSQKLVAWSGGGSVFTLNLDTKVWTKHVAQGSVIPSMAPEQGTYGRFRYIPSKNLFITVNSIDENVWVYRLSSSSGVVSPSKPRNLRIR